MDPESEVEGLARNLAETKVRSLMNPHIKFEPLPGEIEFERKLLLDPTRRIAGVLYDGYKLQDLFLELLPKNELSMDYVHIVFTNRLFGTFDESDGRYHAHVSLYGLPSLVSTVGIVEAPAKPKEFYSLRQQYLALGDQVAVEKLKERFRGRFIDYDDPRLTEVLKGYVMQAMFYHLFGNPFCSDKRCRLWNARWQEEVIGAQLSEPEFCERHSKVLERMKRHRDRRTVLTAK
jgi:predicted Zn-dependent protease